MGWLHRIVKELTYFFGLQYETMLKNFRAQQIAQRQPAAAAQAAEADKAKAERPVVSQRCPLSRLASSHPVVLITSLFVQIPICARHFAAALRTTRPSVPREEVARLRRIYDDFVGARSKGGLPNGEASGEVGGRVSLM